MILNLYLSALQAFCFQDVGFPFTLMLLLFSNCTIKIYGTKKVFKRIVNSIN